MLVRIHPAVRIHPVYGTLVNDLASGKREVTKFGKVKEIRKRDFKKLQAIKVYVLMPKTLAIVIN